MQQDFDEWFEEMLEERRKLGRSDNLEREYFRYDYDKGRAVEDVAENLNEEEYLEIVQNKS